MYEPIDPGIPEPFSGYGPKHWGYKDDDDEGCYERQRGYNEDEGGFPLMCKPITHASPLRGYCEDETIGGGFSEDEGDYPLKKPFSGCEPIDPGIPEPFSGYGPKPRGYDPRPD